MRLTDSAGDGADRAVACAERAALALVRIDDVIREGLAGACRATMLGDVRNVLITVILECGKNRVRRCLAETAGRILFHVVAELFQLIQIFHGSTIENRSCEFHAQ